MRNVSRIRKDGIRARRLAAGGKGLYATPVLRDYYRSHQWLRELRRRGTRVISAVQFRVPDEAEVLVGRYDEDPVLMTATEAVQVFRDHDSGLGLEVILTESIPASWITRIYTPDQVVGWRYYPESHGRKPCGCPSCQRGQMKCRGLRRGYEDGW